MVKNPPPTAGDAKDAYLIPGWERSPGVGKGNPLQYSCLENSMDRGAWWTTVHGVAKSWTQLSTHNKNNPYVLYCEVFVGIVFNSQSSHIHTEVASHSTKNVLLSSLPI